MIRSITLKALILLVAPNVNAQGQFYHSIEETASGYNVIEWNIDGSNLPADYIIESVDELERVYQLQFYINGEMPSNYLCGYEPLITFEYPDDSTIIVSQYHSEGILGGNLECGTPSRTYYTYDPDSFFLLNYRTVLKMGEKTREYWLSEVSEEILENMISDFERSNDNPSFIYWYFYSYMKLNSISPVGHSFEIESVFLSDVIKQRFKETLPEKYAH